MAQPPPPPPYQPSSAPAPKPARPRGGPRVGGYAGSTLVLTGVATFLAGMIVGVGLLWVLRPTPKADENAAASASAPPEVVSSEPTATVSVPPKPAVDPAVAARARKLAELRKKVKVVRNSQLDAQCTRFNKGFGKGYIYDGGSFAENEYVANASGCVALAKTRKAPWFCCKK